MSIATSKLSARKNTQAKTVNRNVVPICHNSLRLGNILFSATTPRLALLRFNKSSGKKYNAFSPPQTINVQLAPCQKSTN